MPEAVLVDAKTGIEKRLAFLEGPHGLLYSWMARPPGATSCVLICSSILGDFISNYHRERQLGLALVAQGFGVVRFHYAGEGNSTGERRHMTFPTMCDDTEVVVSHAGDLGFERFALLGTRVGALVAGKVVSVLGTAPLALWEPVTDPFRFVRDARRAMLIAQVSRDSDRGTSDWREELEGNGVLDLLGYDVYQPLIDSLESLDLASLLGTTVRRIFVARFGRTAARDRLVMDLEQQGFPVSSGSYGTAESWWLNSESVAESDDLVTASTKWLSNAFMDSI